MQLRFSVALAVAEVAAVVLIQPWPRTCICCGCICKKEKRKEKKRKEKKRKEKKRKEKKRKEKKRKGNSSPL